jgi:multidrug efflux system membrane fusion protein
MNLERTQARIVVFLCLILIPMIWQGCSGTASTASSGGAPSKRGEGGGSVPVSVARVVQKDVPIDLQAVGNVEACLTVSVKAQVGGQLVKVFFHEGDFVKEGDTLFMIDQRILQSQLNQAQAALAKDQSQLNLATANLARDQAQEEYARAEAARYLQMLEKGLVSREQMEQFRANANALAAAVHADEAAMQSARAAVNVSQAAVENAKVMLGYTIIASPLDGRTGNLNVKQGNLVTANSMDLVTINQVEPIYVTFSIPEIQLAAVKKGQMVMARPQDDTGPPDVGEVAFIDNAVDAMTGTIRIKGVFPNSDRKLWPGAFVRVTLRLATQPQALVVPNEAVQTGQDGTYVFVVKQDRTVEARPVTTGARVDQDLVIERGLQAGETVVTEGQLRLAPGSRVQIGGASGRGQASGRGGR